MQDTEEIAIVGGGPAGAYCAFQLAKKGIYATIFDGSHPREKPCGGGLTPIATQKFPFLQRFRSKGGSSSLMKIISCTNKQSVVAPYPGGFNVSRQFLDDQILSMALDSGARLVKEKVVAVQKDGDFWKIKTEGKTVKTKIIVGADGVNSLVRQKTIGKLSSKNLGLTYGYFATGMETEPTTIKFVAEIPSYIWIFPRDNHSSIGIGSECKYGAKLKGILDGFVESYCPNIKVIAQFSAMLPWATDPEFFSHPCAGKDWVLIGDAAGHVDPLSGEGILYALWSGELAAKALAQNELSQYDKLWMEQYGYALAEKCKQRNVFFDPIAVELSIAQQNMILKTKS